MGTHKGCICYHCHGRLSSTLVSSSLYNTCDTFTKGCAGYKLGFLSFGRIFVAFRKCLSSVVGIQARPQLSSNREVYSAHRKTTPRSALASQAHNHPNLVDCLARLPNNPLSLAVSLARQPSTSSSNSNLLNPGAFSARQRNSLSSLEGCLAQHRISNRVPAYSARAMPPTRASSNKHSDHWTRH